MTLKLTLMSKFDLTPANHLLLSFFNNSKERKKGPIIRSNKTRDSERSFPYNTEFLRYISYFSYPDIFN